MNVEHELLDAVIDGNCFRPQQGLIIMNFVPDPELFEECEEEEGFRPQQGLIIMNYADTHKGDSELELVSVPNRG